MLLLVNWLTFLVFPGPPTGMCSFPAILQVFLDPQPCVASGFCLGQRIGAEDIDSDVASLWHCERGSQHAGGSNFGSETLWYDVIPQHGHYFYIP